MSLPEREDSEHAEEECCLGLGRDMGESTLWGEEESLCRSRDRASLLGSSSLPSAGTWPENKKNTSSLITIHTHSKAPSTQAIRTYSKALLAQRVNTQSQTHNTTTNAHLHNYLYISFKDALFYSNSLWLWAPICYTKILNMTILTQFLL